MRLKNLSLPAFLKYVCKKDLICLGAGKLLQKLFTVCPTVKIKAVMDNSEKKQSSGISYQGEKFNVYPVSYLPVLIINPSQSVILITASVAGGGMSIYEQMKSMNLPDEVECFFINFIMADSASIPTVGEKLNFRLTEKPLIPSTIHYCWFGGGEIPDWQKELIHGWKKKNPRFEIVRWDESNYDVRQNKYIAKAYDEKKWAFVSDFARKDIVCRYGGIYLDVDVEVIKSLDDLLYQQGFFGVQPDRRVASGLGFGGMPGLDVIQEMRDVYLEEDFLYTDDMGMKVAPDYETEILMGHGYIRNGNLQQVNGLTIYPAEVLSGTLPYSDQSFITENTYTVHHYAGSWTEWQRQLRQKKAIELYEEIMNKENRKFTPD